jgi:uncharacterized membrane protein YfcA
MRRRSRAEITGPIIIIASAWQLLLRLGHKKSGTLEAPRGIKALPYYGLLVIGGIVHGMFSTGGPLVVIYASRAQHNGDRIQRDDRPVPGPAD